MFKQIIISQITTLIEKEIGRDVVRITVRFEKEGNLIYVNFRAFYIKIGALEENIKDGFINKLTGKIHLTE